MTAVSSTRESATEGFTVDDLDAMPDDGRRYELIDGSLIVTPAPIRRHQRAQMGLISLLLPQVKAGQGLELLSAPTDVRIGRTTNLQPDLLICERGDLDDRFLASAPHLVIEILSPSTRHVDLGLKHSAYATLGTPSYWVVDPVEPSIVAWELAGEEYAEVGRATGDETLTLSVPFNVTIVPGALLR